MQAPIEVVGAAILKGGRCLTARRGPGMSDPGKWEFPGGKVEPGEAPEEALAREISEELGLRIEVGEPLGVGLAKSAQGRVIRLQVFRARLLSGTPVLREHDQLRWVGAKSLHALDWSAADIPVLDALAESLDRPS